MRVASGGFLTLWPVYLWSVVQEDHVRLFDLGDVVTWPAKLESVLPRIRLRGLALPVDAQPRFQDGAEMIVVHHFGPDPSDVGGMESLIRTFGVERIGADRVFVHPTRARGRPLRTLWLTVRALAWVLRARPVVVVHVHLSERGSFVREGLIVALAARRGLSVVVSNHGAQFVEFATAHRRLVESVLRCAGVVLSFSEEVERIASRLAPQSHHRRTVNPVRADTSAPPADSTEEIVLFAGEIGVRKGADVLADAWRLVFTRRPNASLVMVGPPTDLKIEPQPGLTVGAPVSSEEVRGLISNARVVALPSRAEAMPVVLIEALGSGRPFVSTPVAGIPTLANGVQALVPVEDHQALADALEELLADPDLARTRGDAGRDWYMLTCSIDAVSIAMRDIYTVALGHYRQTA